jgi:V8-like Glu-specific endopeptidase
VAPNVVLTAGHCIINQRDCNDTRFVFDAYYQKPGKFQYSVPASRVRECKRIIKRYNKRSGLDFALLELDRPMRGRSPVPLSVRTTVTSQVFMIGHPLGLPAKYSGPARIFKETELEWLTDLDSSAGNSGSPVFDMFTGNLVGILTAGEDEDFDSTPNVCHTSKYCTTDTCNGEVVLKAQAIRSAAEF